MVVKTNNGWDIFRFEKNRANKAPAERKTQMIEARKSGKTYAEIGAIFGVTRQRVFEILKGEKKHETVEDSADL